MIKYKLIRNAITSIFILSLSACATVSKFESRMDAKKGLNKEQLIEEMGIPDREYKIGNFEIVEYSQTQTTSTSKTTSSVVNGHLINTTATAPHTMWCKLEFKLVDGLVENYKYKGDMCRSR